MKVHFAFQLAQEVDEAAALVQLDLGVGISYFGIRWRFQLSSRQEGEMLPGLFPAVLKFPCNITVQDKSGADVADDRCRDTHSCQMFMSLHRYRGRDSQGAAFAGDAGTVDQIAFMEIQCSSQVVR